MVRQGPVSLQGDVGDVMKTASDLIEAVVGGESARKVLSEASKDIEIPATSLKGLSSKDYDALDELSYNGIMIDSRDDATPCPWDAGLEVKGSDLVIDGGIGPSGYGSCVCKVPVTSANRIYRIAIQPKNEEAAAKIKAILKMK